MRPLPPLPTANPSVFQPGPHFQPTWFLPLLDKGRTHPPRRQNPRPCSRSRSTPAPGGGARCKTLTNSRRLPPTTLPSRSRAFPPCRPAEAQDAADHHGGEPRLPAAARPHHRHPRPRQRYRHGATRPFFSCRSSARSFLLTRPFPPWCSRRGPSETSGRRQGRPDLGRTRCLPRHRHRLTRRPRCRPSERPPPSPCRLKHFFARLSDHPASPLIRLVLCSSSGLGCGKEEWCGEH
jgi:hypothetical protein